MKQKLINIGNKISDAIEKIFDGFVAMIEKLANKPLTLAGVLVLTLVVIDFFLVGKLGFINYIMKTGNGLVAMLAKIKLETLVIVLLAIVMLKKK